MLHNRHVSTVSDFVIPVIPPHPIRISLIHFSCFFLFVCVSQHEAVFALIPDLSFFCYE